jgi:hypothetical protein
MTDINEHAPLPPEGDTAIVPFAASQNHIALIAGLPTALTYFAAELCRDLLSRVHGTCEVVALNDLGDGTLSRVAAVPGPVVFLAEVPDSAVVELAREAAFPILVVAQGFAAACRDFMAARETGALDAARTMARGQIGMRALAEIPRAALFALEDGASAAFFAERLASSLKVKEDILAAIVASRGLERSLPEVIDEFFVYDRILPSEETDELLNKLDRFYGLDQEHAASLEVPMSALLEAAAPHLPATNLIELSGPARCLTFGPYLNLPKGRWRGRFTFYSRDNASRNSLGFDIAADQEIKVDRDFELHISGRFAFIAEFEIEDSFSPVEFRSFLRQGAIEGRFQPLSLTFERCGSEPELQPLLPTLE